MGTAQNLIPMVGTVWGNWTVISVSSRRSKEGVAYWLCRCVCGEERQVLGTGLRRGSSKSCGSCLSQELRAARRAAMLTHGMSKTSTYRTWHTMRRRCRDKKFRDFPYYGGRGIKVCERWNSFEKFLEDMGERPPGMTLDRKDNNGNYEPGNCRWSTALVQMNNTRGNKYLTYDGKTMSLSDWARHVGIPPPRLSARLRLLHWPLAKALGYEGKP